jgi:hypothetical protein
MGRRRATLLQCRVDEAAGDAVAVHDHPGDLGSHRIALTAHGSCDQVPPLDGTLPNGVARRLFKLITRDARHRRGVSNCGWHLSLRELVQTAALEAVKLMDQFERAGEIKSGKCDGCVPSNVVRRRLMQNHRGSPPAPHPAT